MPRPIKIENCPYCGNDEIELHRVCIDADDILEGYAVHCDNCGLRGPVFYRMARAIRAFNDLYVWIRYSNLGRRDD